MKIYVGFSSARDWWLIGSTIIKLGEKRSYSHAYLRYIDPVTNLNVLSQASHGAINQIEFSLFQKHNKVIKEYEFEITEEQFKLLQNTIKQNLGIPYGSLELIWISIKKVFHIELNIHDKNTTMICSEFVGMLLTVLNILKPDDLDYLTPSDLDTLIQHILQE